MGYKIKRILVGDKQVRPAYLYKYEYDFRNKSNTTLTNDGWTLDNSSYTACNSNGIYCTTNTIIRGTRSLPSLANARKIKFLETVIVASNNTSYALGASFRSYTDSTSTKKYGIVINQDQGYNIKGGYVVSNTQTLPYSITSTGTYTNELVYDLENKSIKYTIGGNTYTGTLTDSNITDIKSNNGAYIYVGQIYTSTPLVYIQSVGVIVF